MHICFVILHRCIVHAVYYFNLIPYSTINLEILDSDEGDNAHLFFLLFPDVLFFVSI